MTVCQWSTSITLQTTSLFRRACRAFDRNPRLVEADRLPVARACKCSIRHATICVCSGSDALQRMLRDTRLGFSRVTRLSRRGNRMSWPTTSGKRDHARVRLFCLLLLIVHLASRKPAITNLVRGAKGGTHTRDIARAGHNPWPHRAGPAQLVATCRPWASADRRGCRPNGDGRVRFRSNGGVMGTPWRTDSSC